MTLYRLSFLATVVALFAPSVIENTMAFTAPNVAVRNKTSKQMFLFDSKVVGEKSTVESSFQLEHAERRKREWIERSVDYYSRVMRVERRRDMGQIDSSVFESQEYQERFLILAKKHYFALQKIREGQHRHAEIIYQKIVDEIIQEDNGEGCDHAKLAITTLLLALHLQRMGEIKRARSVFLNFFRVVIAEKEEDHDTQCACSAKVLGAYALFEMKRGNRFMSWHILQKAVQFDPSLKTVMQWKQFSELANHNEKRLQP